MYPLLRPFCVLSLLDEGIYSAGSRSKPLESGRLNSRHPFVHSPPFQSYAKPEKRIFIQSLPFLWGVLRILSRRRLRTFDKVPRTVLRSPSTFRRVLWHLTLGGATPLVQLLHNKQGVDKMHVTPYVDDGCSRSRAFARTENLTATGGVGRRLGAIWSPDTCTLAGWGVRTSGRPIAVCQSQVTCRAWSPVCSGPFWSPYQAAYFLKILKSRHPCRIARSPSR